VEIRFAEAAEEDLADAYEYYEDQLPGLGAQLAYELGEALRRVREFPRAWSLVGKVTRRCSLKRFPYSILYVVESDTILVSAIACQHRFPAKYSDRIR
jgi:plasmid stabilization system protein ParE